ncbi:hypothetical protein [Streptomyces poriferorum]|uniref:Uncharacterized protein n=1 Tax=Streptomyces poriferorum TaxID=2798799 RepID=A0ABY9IW97_9ACTN|nr:MULTISPECIES: hypothetical protein [unclassified Streptomyces]MDP5312707.1 hypothetical protein [Streptomyces sp. Alt4]WLQ58273.1 hypothetical protein P8A19_23830 [Streptomyces sp. Alt2]
MPAFPSTGERTGGVRVPGRTALVPVGVGRAGRKVLGRLEAHLAARG